MQVKPRKDWQLEQWKEALCALVFFFKDVCGMEEVDLEVKLRKTSPRVPVVLEVEELLALIAQLTSTWSLAAQLQYGTGLRRSELLSLRIKDVDLKRRTITVRGGKGDKDCLAEGATCGEASRFVRPPAARQWVTVFPEVVVKPFELRKEVLRAMYEADRAAGCNGVALPGALGRKMPRAGERSEWFWFFPADHESSDPETGVARRHHLHPGIREYSIRGDGRSIAPLSIPWSTSARPGRARRTVLCGRGRDGFPSRPRWAALGALWAGGCRGTLVRRARRARPTLGRIALEWGGVCRVMRCKEN